MAVLTTQERKHLASSTFAVPSKREFPIPDKSHATAALRLLGRAKDLTPDEKKAVIRKANEMLKRGK